MSSGCRSLPGNRPNDGYVLYMQACEQHDALYATLDPAIWQEIRRFRDHGEPIGAPAQAFIAEHQTIFDILAKAAQVDFWSLPDITTFSAETTFPYLSPWLRMNNVATVHAIEMYLDGRSHDALCFLYPFHAIGQRVSRAGTLLHILIHISCRSMQYPVLAASIDSIPDTLLAPTLAKYTQQYLQIPSIDEVMVGERHMATNTVRELFSDMRLKLLPYHLQMMKNVKQAGVDEKVRQKMERGAILSIDNWEHDTLSELSSIHALTIEGLTTRPSDEMGELDDEIAAAVEEIGGDLDMDRVMFAWKHAITNQQEGVFSLQDAEELHATVGRAISYQILQVLVPVSGKFGVRYREFIASERLLLIRLAVRLYTLDNGHPPEHLQQLVDSGYVSETMIIDPLSGVLFLTQTDPAFVVYSVGRNFSDHGGVPWNHDSQSGDAILLPLKDMWRNRQSFDGI